MCKTQQDDPARSLVDMLRYVIDKPRVVLYEVVDPKLRYARDTEDAIAPREDWLLVFGASVEGPCEWAAIQLVVGEFAVGALRSNLLYVIPPRQNYRLLLPNRFEPLLEHLLDKDTGVLPGCFRLFGWQFNDADYLRWRKEQG